MGTEHLLLGLAREGKGVAAQVLRGVGLDAARLKEHIAQLVGVGESGSRPSQGLTPRCKRVIELALEESRKAGTRYVGTEHLLAGILREGEGVAVRYW